MFCRRKVSGSIPDTKKRKAKKISFHDRMAPLNSYLTRFVALANTSARIRRCESTVNCRHYVIPAVYVLVKIKLYTFKCGREGWGEIYDEGKRTPGGWERGRHDKIIAVLTFALRAK